MSYISKIKNQSPEIYSCNTYLAYDDKQNNVSSVLNKIKKDYQCPEFLEVLTNIKKLYYKDVVLSEQENVEFNYIVPIPYNNIDFKNLNIEIAKRLSKILGIKYLDKFFIDYDVPEVDIRDRYINENSEIKFSINKKYISKKYNYINILFVDMYCSNGEVLYRLAEELNLKVGATFIAYNIRTDSPKLKKTYIEDIKLIENEITSQVNDGIVVKIKGLFNEKDVTVDLRNSISIIIGENGIGKSTSYRIASLATNHTYEGLLGLLSYPFNEILIFYFDKAGNCYKKEKIVYYDLLPKKDALQNIFKSLNSFYEYDEIFKDLNLDEILLNNINLFLNKLDEKEYHKIYKKILTKNPTYKYDFIRNTQNNKIDLDCEEMAVLLRTICEKLVTSSSNKKFLLTKDSLYLCLAYSSNLKEFLPTISAYDQTNFNYDGDDYNDDSANDISTFDDYQNEEEDIFDNMYYPDDDYEYNDEYEGMSDSYYNKYDNTEDDYAPSQERKDDSYDDIYDEDDSYKDYLYDNIYDENEYGSIYFDFAKKDPKEQEASWDNDFTQLRHILLKTYMAKFFMGYNINKSTEDINVYNFIKDSNIQLLNNSNDIEYFQINFDGKSHNELLTNYYKPRSIQIDKLKVLFNEEDFDLNKVIKILNEEYYNEMSSDLDNDYMILFQENSFEDNNKQITQDDFIKYIYGKNYADFNYAFFTNLKSNYQKEFEQMINDNKTNWYKTKKTIKRIINTLKIDCINPILKKAEKYINKYLVDKKMTIYPSCVIFSNDNGRFIPCHFLSSGEKNLVLLFLLASMLRYYIDYKTEENYNLILDEPEISMNIEWQEDLIEDLKNCLGEKINLTILTQSPQLLQNERLYAYLHDLLDNKIELDETSSFEEIQITPFNQIVGDNNEN